MNKLAITEIVEEVVRTNCMLIYKKDFNLNERLFHLLSTMGLAKIMDDIWLIFKVKLIEEVHDRTTSNDIINIIEKELNEQTSHYSTR